MKINCRVILIGVLAIGSSVLFSCNRLNYKYFEPYRFEKDLVFSLHNDPGNYGELLKKYPDFFPVFCSDIITIGPYNSPETGKYLEQFVNDPVISSIHARVDSIFGNFDPYSKRIQAGLHEFNKLLGRNDTIRLITYISGFNQSFVSLPGILGISLDNFMGSDTEYYKQLAIPNYLRQTMNPENLSVNAVRAWIMSEFIETSNISTLLDNMIYQGKILYLLSESMPGAEDNEILNYSPEQEQWCRDYESTMWEYLIENELLYSADRVLISRMTKEAPFVREFSQDSPGRAGSWLGFRIVRSFMKKTKTPASDLINITDARKILADSRYRPG